MQLLQQQLRNLVARVIPLALLMIGLVLVITSVYTYTRTGTDARVSAATSSNLNYQARLLNANGSVVPDGMYNIEFKLYDGGNPAGTPGVPGSANAGTNVWTETRTGANAVRVVNGYLSSNLGDVTAFGAGILWDQDHWLTMNIGGVGAPVWDGEMSPRIKLTSVPYAFQAKRAEMLNQTQGANTGILDFLSLTANRTISLPDASGTVLLDTTGFANGGNSFAGTAVLGTKDTNGLSFITDDIERIRIDSTGNVRIGTGADANEKLQVDGGINIGNSSNTNAGTLRWTGTDFEGYNGTQWKSLTGGGALTVNPTANVRKSVDETQNSGNNATATLQNDDELTFNAGANETWSFRFVVTANANATPDIKFAVSAPTGAVCRVGVQDAEGATTVGNLGCSVSSGLVPGNTAEDIYEITGTVVNGATAGPITLQWAQNTANVANTTIRNGSFLAAQRISGPGQSATALLQNGNSFGADATLGTNDNYGLKFITNGLERGSFSDNGLMTLLNGLSVSSGNLNISSGELQIGGTTVITNTRELQNVTANTSILNAGTLSNVRGGTGLDTSTAANGQLLIGNGTGFSLGTISDDGGLNINNTAGGIGLSVTYGSAANTAVEGDTGLVCTAGTGNLSGGGNTITLGSGGTCNGLTMNDAVAFVTSVTTPLITNAGALTIQTTGGANSLMLASGSGLINVNASSIATTGGLSYDLVNAANSTFAIGNSGAGVANLNLSDGELQIAGTSVLTSGRSLQNLTGLTIASGGASITGNTSIIGTLSGLTGFTQTSGNFNQNGSGSFSTGSGTVSLNGETTVTTNTTNAGLNVFQSGNGANLNLTNTARTSGALINLSQSTSAFTGTGLLFNFANGSGSFASGSFLDFQTNGTSRFRVDNTGGLTIATSSSNALQINNTGGLSMLNVDSSANIVGIGSTTADATAVLLMLDSKTGADPTGQNGGSYYNATNNKFRCFEAGDWKDCITEAPRSGIFEDITAAAFAGDNQTTQIFNDAVKPNIITRSVNSAVQINVHISGLSNTNNDAFFAARVVFTTNGVDPTCASPQVGRSMISGFTTATTHPYQMAGSFMHKPGVEGTIKYTVCSSDDATGTLTDTADNITVSIAELGPQ